jgi:hypothetical protein
MKLYPIPRLMLRATLYSSPALWQKEKLAHGSCKSRGRKARLYHRVHRRGQGIRAGAASHPARWPARSSRGAPRQPKLDEQGSVACSAPCVYWAPLNEDEPISISMRRSGILPSCDLRTRSAKPSAHLANVRSGFPFSTIYVASSAPIPLPTFFAEWMVPAGMNNTSPALSVTGGLPSS